MNQNVTISSNLVTDKPTEQIQTEESVSEVSADPFYSDSNINYLESIARDIKDGKAHFSEHDLIEL